MTDHISPRVRGLLTHVRAIATNDGPDDPRERALAVAGLLASAAVLAWPKGKKLPVPPDYLIKGVSVANFMWQRRHWWLPSETPPEVIDLTKPKED